MIPDLSSFGQYLQLLLLQILSGFMPCGGLGGSTAGGYLSLDFTRRSLRFCGLLCPNITFLRETADSFGSVSSSCQLFSTMALIGGFCGLYGTIQNKGLSSFSDVVLSGV